jgi:uncharacterized protein (DUF1697 family)
MTEWVALLRGVNVGGIVVRSADLRALAVELGLEDARTVLASGNLVFRSDTSASDRDRLKLRIEKALRDRFGYDASILLITRDEGERAADAFPFDADDDDRQPWVIFCLDAETRDELMDAAASLDARADPVSAGSGVVYWNPVKGTTVDTPFAKVLARAAFKRRTTNRNLRTLRKILG